MQARNADEHGSVPEGSPRAEHSDRDRRLRELDWKSLPSIKLPRTSFGREEQPRKRKPPAAKDIFEVQAAGWRLESVQDLAAAVRPDPAFRRFHPIAAGLLMLDDLGNARGFDDGEAAVLRYERAGRPMSLRGSERTRVR
jgi:hypothetical protein